MSAWEKLQTAKLCGNKPLNFYIFHDKTNIWLMGRKIRKSLQHHTVSISLLCWHTWYQPEQSLENKSKKEKAQITERLAERWLVLWCVSAALSGWRGTQHPRLSPIFHPNISLFGSSSTFIPVTHSASSLPVRPNKRAEHPPLQDSRIAQQRGIHIQQRAHIYTS